MLGLFGKSKKEPNGTPVCNRAWFANSENLRFRTISFGKVNVSGTRLRGILSFLCVKGNEIRNKLILNGKSIKTGRKRGPTSPKIGVSPIIDFAGASLPSWAFAQRFLSHKSRCARWWYRVIEISAESSRQFQRWPITVVGLDSIQRHCEILSVKTRFCRIG